MTEKNDSVKQDALPPHDRERLIDIQSRVTHQERIIQQLSDEVFLQSKRISDLEQICGKLVDRINASQSSPPTDPLDEKPPHY